MGDLSDRFTIGGLAKSAGVSIETVRFYQREGLIPEPRRAPGSIRRYGSSDIERVRFIKSAQRLGFTLVEIADLLVLDDGTHCNEARALAQGKLDDVRVRLDDLRRMESVLAHLVKECGATRGRVTCPLVAALRGDP